MRKYCVDSLCGLNGLDHTEVRAPGTLAVAAEPLCAAGRFNPSLAAIQSARCLIFDKGLDGGLWERLSVRGSTNRQ